MAKKSPPRPKSTANLPPGLKKYWANKGVSTATSTSKTSTAKKSGRKTSTARKKTATRKRKRSAKKK